MRQGRCTEEPIVGVVRERESGLDGAETGHKHAISPATWDTPSERSGSAGAGHVSRRSAGLLEDRIHDGASRRWSGAAPI